MVSLGRRNKSLAFVVVSICFFIFFIKKNFKSDFVIFSFMIFIIIVLMLWMIYLNKRYEKLYKLSELNKSKYNMAIDLLEAALWEWNSETGEFYISPKIKTLLSINKENIGLFDLFSYVVEEERNDLKLFFDDMIRDRVVDNFIIENNIINDLGQRLTIEMQIKSSLKDGVFFISGMIKDITEKKQKENIKRAIENKNRLAVEGSKDIAFWWNVRQNVISLNKRIREYIDFDGERCCNILF